MVAVLIRQRIRTTDIRMSHDDNREHSNREERTTTTTPPSPLSDDVQRTLVWSPPTPATQRPPSASAAMEDDDSRDQRDPHYRAASPPAAATTVNVTMSSEDITQYNTESPFDFERRDEQRSAFSSVQPSQEQEQESSMIDVDAQSQAAEDEEIVREDRSRSKQDQHQVAESTAEKAESRSSSPGPDPETHPEHYMPHPVRPGAGEPLPYSSPLRYYHERPPRSATQPPQQDQQQHQQHTPEEGEDAETHEAPPYPYHHQYPRGYPPPPYHHHQQYPYYPPGYYHHHHHPAMPPPEQRERDTSPYPAYPSYQEYGVHPQEYGGSPYSYYPPGGQHNPYPYQPHHYYQGATPPSSQGAPDTLKDPPSAITESTKGTTPSSAMASRKPSDGGEGEERGEAEGLDPSAVPALPSMEDDDRKPAAAGRAGTPDPEASGPTIRGILKKESPPKGSPGDFEPIPLHEIAAIPVLSSSAQPAAGGGHPPSPYAQAGHSSPYDHAGISSPYDHAGHSSPYDHSYHHGTYHAHPPYPQAHPPRAASTPPPQGQFAAPRPPRAASAATASQRAAVLASAAAASQHVAPPAPRSTPVTRRQQQQQQRTIAPSSSGSTAGSGSAGGGEGGSWERRFTELVEFKRQHGHCEVPQNYAENTSLGTWVNKQRMEQKNRIEGKNSSLNDSRLERLQSISFRWAKRKGQASWDEKFNELVGYKNRYGNCHVPTKYKDNTALGRWVSTQRAEYKKYQEGAAKTSMNADKIRRLEGIGFAWFMAL